MPKDRKKKKTSGWDAHREDSMDSLGLTQVLSELKDVPDLGPEDMSFNLEDVLAEFGSGEKAAQTTAAQVKPAQPRKSAPAPKPAEPVTFKKKPESAEPVNPPAHKAAPMQAPKPHREEVDKPKAAPKREPTAKKADTIEFPVVGKEKNREQAQAEAEIRAVEVEIPKNQPKLITNIVRPWEDGMFGDLKLEEKPDPAPWEKRQGKHRETASREPRVKKPAPEPTLEREARPMNPDKLRGPSVHRVSDTLTSIRTGRINELFDDEGETRGFRATKKEPELLRELPGEYIRRELGPVRRCGVRALMLFLVCLPVCYLAFAPQMGWPLPGFLTYGEHPFRFVLALAVAQCAAMALSFDVIASGIRSLCKLSPTMESAVAFASLASLAHAIAALCQHGVSVSQPYCAISCITLFFTTYGLYLRGKARLRACKTAGAVKEPTGVFAKEWYGDSNVFKHKVEDQETFVGHLTARDGAARFWSFFSTMVIVASVTFASVSSFGIGKPGNFLWSLAAVSSLSAPFFVMLCYAQPFAVICKKLTGFGAAIAGWYAAQELSGEQNVIIRDADLFPNGCVGLHGLKVFGSHSLEKTLAYTTSIIKESRSGLYKVFAELLKSQFGKTERVYNLKYHESGGVEAEVQGDRVLLGTAGFMLRMGIRVSENANVKNAIFIAVNAELAGVYNVTYKINPEVQNGLFAIIRRKLKPVLAAIDFNLTPVMVEKEFQLPMGSIEYPNIEERLDLSSEDQIIDKDPCAMVARGGFAPFAYSILAARRLRSSTVRNVLLSAACAVIGMLLMFYLAFVGSVAAATPYNVFVYLALWTLPAFIISHRTGSL